MAKEQLIEDAHMLMHPLRFRMVEVLQEKPMHINAVSKAIKVERRLATYHLVALEEHGFVKSKYEISLEGKSKGKAIRVYWITDKVASVIAQMKREL